MVKPQNIKSTTKVIEKKLVFIYVNCLKPLCLISCNPELRLTWTNLRNIAKTVVLLFLYDYTLSFSTIISSESTPMKLKIGLLVDF